MGFSVKLAPGLRVRVSGRGVRTSVGPRIARAHVGAGGVGFSTGVGPVGYYTHLSGNRRRASSSGSANRKFANAARRTAMDEKTGKALEFRDSILHLLQIHREDFAPASRPVIPIAPPADPVQTFTRHRQQAVASTSVFDRRGRRAALRTAELFAQNEIESQVRQAAVERASAQVSADAFWEALGRCEPDVVLPELAAAFSDNDAAASAVGLSGTQISLVVVVPSESAVPDRMPGVTEAGNLNLRRLTKTEAAALYESLVCGYLLVTLKEAFAVVPALTGAHIVAVRPSAIDAYGRVRAEAVLAGHCSREALQGVSWSEVGSLQIVTECFDSKLIRVSGRSGALLPVSTTGEPDLAALLEAISFDSIEG